MTSDSARPASDLEPVLRAAGVQKRYGGVHALRGVDFEVRAGEVHGLVGENGAGKSTLIKMLAGAETPDVGTVTIGGEALRLGDTQASLAAGISTVYQEPHLFGELSVAENIFVGRELTSKGRVRWEEQRTLVAQLLEQIGLDPDLAVRNVADLPVGEQQLISIAKAFATEVKILILDEPSAILADQDIDTLFEVVRRMRSTGVGVIYISHRLDELGQIADRVTVMRDGAIVATRPMEELSTRQIAELMVGHELERLTVQREVVSDDVVLDVRGIAGGKAMKDVSFQLRRGEILGVYGLIGSGTSDLARAMFGITPAGAGEISVNGETARLRSPADAADAGFAMVPGNRKSEGVFHNKSLAFNISASHLRYFSKAGLVFDANRERATTLDLMKKLRVKAPGPETRIGALSGGNQQKVVIARQLVESPSVLVLEEPTQGVDVGSKDEIHRLVLELAAEGTASLVISTDLEEIRTLSDRIIVLHQGQVWKEFPGDTPTATLLAAASGADETAADADDTLEPGDVAAPSTRPTEGES